MRPIIQRSFCGLLIAMAACRSTPPSPATRPVVASVADHFPQTVNPRDTVPFLASDELAGRAPGTPGLVEAGDFLAGEFRRIGLQPLPELGGYFQPFTMHLNTTVAPGTSLLIDDKSLIPGTDFSPLSFTAQGPFRGGLVFAGFGITRQAGDYDDFSGIDAAGKVVMAMRREPRDSAGHSRFAGPNRQWSDDALFGTKAKNAAAHGAVALLVVSPPSTGGSDEVMPFFDDSSNTTASIPVLQISRRVANLLLTMRGADDLETLQRTIDSTGQPHSLDFPQTEISGDVTLTQSSAQVRNIVGYLPGTGPHADEYVIVGAHYDHLGTGQLGHMLGAVGQIYHGADDNASGDAAVLELAQKLAQAGPLPRTVVFALFTAEEEGLIGSDWFVKHPPLPLNKVVAMLNLDMVGRLRDDNLLVGGWGTAGAFDSIVKQAVAGTPLKIQSFEKGGLGPSDHMSFALQKIPVLFFFTGLHADYHRPTDTADKINYDGIDDVVTVCQHVVESMATMPRQEYQSTDDARSTMSVTLGRGETRRAALGVVPDFGSADSTVGVPISGVGPGSAADAAGLKAGDVLTRFNDHALTNLQDLSDALSQANPGDKVKLVIRRDGQPLTISAVLGQRKSE